MRSLASIMGPIVGWALLAPALALAEPPHEEPRSLRHEEAPSGRHEFTQVHMGVSFRIILYADDPNLANRAADAAFARIASLDAIMSDYRDDSELMQLCRNTRPHRPTKLSEDLHQVLARSQQLSFTTEGAFDVTVGHLVRLWRRARRQQRLPPGKLLQAAREKTDYANLVVDKQVPQVTLKVSDLRLDLGGIAKGYAADAALAVLKSCGVPQALVDASGDIAAGAPPPESESWTIGIAPLEDADGQPSRYLQLAHQAVATSGDYWQFVEIDGRRYSHIVDPRTGLGVQGHSRVTVVATDATTADGWASALSVLGPDDGICAAEAVDSLEAFVEFQRDGNRVTRETNGFASYDAPQQDEYAAP